ESRLAPGDADVAHRGEVAASAHGGAVDRGDRRRLERVHRHGDALDAVDVASPRLGRAAAEEAGPVAHVLDVAPRGETFARTGDDHAADAQVRVDAIDRGHQGLDDGV